MLWNGYPGRCWESRLPMDASLEQ